MREEQFATNKLYSSLCFDFGDDGERYYIIEEKLFKTIIELIKENME